MTTSSTPDFDSRPAHQRWMAAAAVVLQRTNRILSGDPNLRTTTANDGPAPGWSTDTEITLRTSDFAQSQDTARLLGLNYHELSHVLFTPREKSNAGTLLRNLESKDPFAGIWRAFNAAEDQRIESLFSALYSPAVPFFTRAVADLILTNPASIPTAYALLAGRRYLPAALRAELRDAYVGNADEVDSIMDAYRWIDWVSDVADGVALVERFAAELQSLPQPPHPGCSQGTVAGSGMPDLDQVADAQDQMEDDEDGDTPDTTTPAEEMPGNDGDGDSEQDSDGGEGEGPSDGQSQAESKLQEAKEQAESRIEAEADKMEEQIQDAIDAGLGAGEFGDGMARPDQRVVVTDAARAMAHELRSVLAELRAEIDPGWERGTPRGRINPGRFLRAESWELDDVFDEYVPGMEDAMDVEVAILVDQSSSMLRVRSQVAEAAWALKSALDSYDIPAAVVGFGNDARLMFSPDEQADETWMPAGIADGWTQIGPAVWEVGSWFSRSRASRRILVALTDGEYAYTWSHWDAGREVHHQICDLIPAVDAEQRILLRYRQEGQAAPEGWDDVRDIHTPDDLVVAVREAIVEGAARMMARM